VSDGRWVQRLVEGELAQMLEPWHLRGDAPDARRSEDAAVGACGTVIFGVIAKSDYPPEVRSRCSECDKLFRSQASKPPQVHA
jgi:hypothetical protein